MKLKIFLLEDKVDDAKSIVEALNNTVAEKELSEELEFEHFQGTIECDYEHSKHIFYEEEIIQRLEEKKQELQQNVNAGSDEAKMGILLDVFLTQKETIDLDNNYITQAELSSKIYSAFSETVPVYIITSASSFDTSCETIMGVDLSEQYILKSALLRYKLKEAIDALFDFYRKYYNTSDLQ